MMKGFVEGFLMSAMIILVTELFIFAQISIFNCILKAVQ